jgi:hypothetical protein
MNPFAENSGVDREHCFAPELLTFNVRVYERFDNGRPTKKLTKTRFVSS